MQRLKRFTLVLGIEIFHPKKGLQCIILHSECFTQKKKGLLVCFFRAIAPEHEHEHEHSWVHLGCSLWRRFWVQLKHRIPTAGLQQGYSALRNRVTLELCPFSVSWFQLGEQKQWFEKHYAFVRHEKVVFRVYFFKSTPCSASLNEHLNKKFDEEENHFRILTRTKCTHQSRYDALNALHWTLLV